MLKRSIAFIVIWLAVLSSVCWASCDAFYPLGKPIVKPGAIELCNASYVVVFDPVAEAALFSSEHFRNLPSVPRVDAFHADSRVPNGPTPSMYVNSGYDKGHLTPAESATNSTEEYDTFLITNMTPQSKVLNEAKWRVFEASVRAMKPNWILTGAIYPSVPKYMGKTHIPVPSGYYKIIWTAKGPQAWYADNLDTASVVAVTISSLEAKTGLSFPH